MWLLAVGHRLLAIWLLANCQVTAQPVADS